MNFDGLFESFKNIHVAVIGDVMLDAYWWGKVDRISPEAPVPVVALDHKEYRLGGASNVGLNLVSLGAKVSMHTVTGADEEAPVLQKMMQEKGIDVSGILTAANRITTTKTRIVCRNQHMMRLDNETTANLDEATEAAFISQTIAFIESRRPQVVIFEDYNKGVLTEAVITAIIAVCKNLDIVTSVDPKRSNFFAYRGVDIFKPNLKEAREALNILDKSASIDNLRTMHHLLHAQLEHRISFITLSEKGVFYQDETNAVNVPAHIRNISDVSGAGDTVIAVASLVYAATKNVQLMAEVANLAGGLVCEEVGTVAIDAAKLLEECRQLPA